MANGSAIKIVPRNAGENAAIVARAYEAFNVRDVATLTKLFDENSSWHTPGRCSIAGSHMGRDAVLAQFGRYGTETSGTFRANLLNLLESDDGRVVAVHYNCAERNGKHLDVLCCIVLELQNGQIIIGREHFYDLYAWDAFWSQRRLSLMRSRPARVNFGSCSANVMSASGLGRVKTFGSAEFLGAYEKVDDFGAG